MKRSAGFRMFSLLVCCTIFLIYPRDGFGHGVSEDTIGSEVTISCDSQYLEIMATLDLPISLALELRDKLDLNKDYRVSLEEQKKLLPLIYKYGAPVSLTVDGNPIFLAPLFNPKLELSRNPDLAGRGKLRFSWFAYTPENIKKGSKLVLVQHAWPQFKTLLHAQLKGEEGYQFEEDKATQKANNTGQKRQVVANVISVGKKTEIKGQAGLAKKIDLEDRIVPANAVFLAEALMRNYSYLLPEKDSGRVRDLHRRLRMEIQKVQQAKKGEDNTAALTKLDQAGAELVEVLEKTDFIPINLKEKDGLKGLSEPFELPGDEGAVLLQIKNGSGIQQSLIYDHSFKIYDHSIPLKAFVDPVDLGSIGKGMTWALVCLKGVPPDPTHLRLSMGRDDGEVFYYPLKIKSPQPARLKLTVLSDDTGQPAPAMVNLRWMTCNIDRRLPNIVDIVTQLDGQGGQTSHRHASLPGNRRIKCWVLAEPFEMTLPPGDYHVYIRRGVEHDDISETFTLKPGERVEKTYRPERWIDMPGEGWYSGDDHVHSQILSDTDAKNLLTYLAAEGVNVANIAKMSDIHRTFFQQRGFGKEFRVSNGLNHLSPGQESPRTHQQLGHTLSMNTRSMVRDVDTYYLYDTTFDEVHRQGGLSGYAHIDIDRFYVHRDMSLNIPRGKVDFAEILQFGNLGTDLYYEFLNLGFPLTASAGSDLPWGGTIGEVRVYAYLGDQKFSVDRWFEAFGKGRTFVSNGPMLDLKVEGAYPGDTIELEGDRPVKVQASLRINPELGAEKLELIAHGEVIESVSGKGLGQGEISMEIELPVKGGIWLALKGTGADGSLAHTTPVYISREGRRFWKMAEVESLIKKRLGNLKEIEAIVAQARKDVDEGLGPIHTEIHQLAKQGDQLLERVELVKGIYADLMKKYQREVREP